MALNSYLPDVAGGPVAAGVFDEEEAAIAAVKAIRDLGLRRQEVSVLAGDAQRARRVAEAAGASTPHRSGLSLPFRSGLPKSVRSRYGRVLDAGKIVVIAAADGQPAATIATVFERVTKASDVAAWWQEPSGIFPPAEEAGPL